LFLPIIAYTLLFNKIRDKGKNFCWVLRGWGGIEGGGVGGKGGGGDKGKK
jgi:hypothetical protein